MYRFITAGLDGSELEEIPTKNLVYTYSLNNPGSYSYTMPMRHSKCRRDIMDPGKNEFHIYLGTEKIWGGYLWTAQKQDESIRFGGEGYFSRLDKKREVTEDRNYSSGWDQYDLVWDLIDYTQDKPSGNMGITRDSTAKSGVTRYHNIKASEQKKIGQIIRNLSEQDDGFDFEITPEKSWRTYTRKGGNSGLIFVMGKNIRTYTFEVDAISKTVSDFYALGRGQGDARPRAFEFDAEARGAFGLMEDTRSFDAELATTLTALAKEWLRLHKQAREDIALFVITDDPPFGSYTTGDIARIVIDDGYVQVNREMRIRSIVVNVPDEGVDSYGIYFDEPFE